jgi:hypothetical protein
MGLLDRLTYRLLPPPELANGERVVWKAPAATAEPPGHGGTLYVTTQRVIYIDNKLNPPPRFNRAWPLDNIESISIAKPDWTPYTGGMQRRLRMTTTEGDVLFKTRHLDERAARLREAIFGRPKNASR